MRTTLLSSVIALSLIGLGSASVHAQESLPLSGNAYRIAEQAFGAYDRGDYQQAYRTASEAVRLRPDVARLRLLQIYAAQKLGRTDEARALARRALADGISDPALPGLAAAAPRAAAAAGTNVRGATAARPTAAELAYQRAFPLAAQAYEAFNSDRMEEAASKAEQAFRQQPQQVRGRSCGWPRWRPAASWTRRSRRRPPRCRWARRTAPIFLPRSCASNASRRSCRRRPATRR